MHILLGILATLACIITAHAIGSYIGNKYANDQVLLYARWFHNVLLAIIILALLAAGLALVVLGSGGSVQVTCDPWSLTAFTCLFSFSCGLRHSFRKLGKLSADE